MELIIGIVIWYLIGALTCALITYFYNKKLKLNDLLKYIFISLFGPILTVFALYDLSTTVWKDVVLWKRKD